MRRVTEGLRHGKPAGQPQKIAFHRPTASRCGCVTAGPPPARKNCFSPPCRVTAQHAYATASPPPAWSHARQTKMRLNTPPRHVMERLRHGRPAARWKKQVPAPSRVMAQLNHNGHPAWRKCVLPCRRVTAWLRRSRSAALQKKCFSLPRGVTARHGCVTAGRPPASKTCVSPPRRVTARLRHGRPTAART